MWTYLYTVTIKDRSLLNPTCTCVTELSDVDVMLGLVADGIVEHTAVGVFILIFHLQR